VARSPPFLLSQQLVNQFTAGSVWLNIEPRVQIMEIELKHFARSKIMRSKLGLDEGMTGEIKFRRIGA